MAVETQARPQAFSEGSRTESMWQRCWPWAPLPLAGLYLILLLAQFQQVITATYLNADAASAPVLGSLAGHGSGAIVLGNLPWYSTLLFELTTRELPLHRQLWELAPYAMTLASVAFIAWSLWRIAGRWAALLAAAVLLCASPQLLLLLFSLNDHSPTWFTLALLGAWAVALQYGTLPRGRWAPPLLLSVGVLIAVIAGCNAASDRLAVVGGLIPLALSGVVAWRRYPSPRSRAAAAGALATAVLAGIVAALTTHAMHSHGVTSIGDITFGSPAQVQANFSLWWQSLAFLGNGNFFSSAVGFHGVLAAACAVVVLAAAAGALRASWLGLSGAVSPRPAEGNTGRVASSKSADGNADGVASSKPADGNTGRVASSKSADEDSSRVASSQPAERNAGRIAYISFWASAGLLLSAAYLLSSTPFDLYSCRYLVGVLYAAVALVVLLVEYRPALRGLVVTGAFIYCLGGVIAMAQGTATKNPSRYPESRIAGQVMRIASREHLMRGYAGYWDAAPITWATKLGVHVYPVFSCPAGLCQFYLHTIAAWYRPHPGQRSFLLTDPTQPFLATPPAELGPPSARFPIGQVTMYVYPYDIATRISPP
jgi:hypothetical protein